MRVLFLSRYGNLGPSSRLRTFQYIPFLESQGIDCTIMPFFGNEYVESLYGKRKIGIKYILNKYLSRLATLLTSHKYDLLWIEKELFPWVPAYLEKLLRIMSVPYVVDYDDAVFHSYDLHKSSFVRYILGKKIDTVMKNAQVVIVGNEYLASRALAAGAKRVEIIPTVIDLNRYTVKNKQSENKGVTVGWIGTPNTTKYLNLVRSALEDVSKDWNIKLMLVGAGKIDFGDLPVEVTSWSEASEVSQIQQFDIGIMPLFDQPFERGKCGYKLIQYMACGKPVIASPVGVNAQIVEHGVNGFLATSPSEWAAALNCLCGNKSIRDEIGKTNREKIEKDFCLQVTAPKVLSIIRGA